MTYPWFVHGDLLVREIFGLCKTNTPGRVVKVEVRAEILECRLAGASDTETGTDWVVIILCRHRLDHGERCIDFPDREGR